MIGFIIQSSFAVFTLYMESVRREKRESDNGGKFNLFKVNKLMLQRDFNVAESTCLPWPRKSLDGKNYYYLFCRRKGGDKKTIKKKL
jgi:hypothetical protein